MKRLILGLVPLLFAAPAFGQSQDTGAKPEAATPSVEACPPEHAAMGHCKPATETSAPASDMPGMDMAPAADPCPPEHAAMGHCTPAAAPAKAKAEAPATGTDLAAGDAPPPPAPTDRAADRFYPAGAMQRANSGMRREHGGMTYPLVMLNLAEVQIRNGRDGYRWDGEASFGGDIDRFVVKTEGEGGFRDRVDDAEIQALYSRAIGPYFNLQAGVRQDLGAGARPTYAAVGFEGLAPYWFEVEGALFLSDKGNLLGRIEGYYDQRITQRLILQPRVEFNLAAQDVRDSRIGSGLSDAELGLRLRYEVAREFAPYVGVSWERRFGDSARFARADGEGTGGVSLALGIRAWF
jgi:copper resistance protein B